VARIIPLKWKSVKRKSKIFLLIFNRLSSGPENRGRGGCQRRRNLAVLALKASLPWLKVSAAMFTARAPSSKRTAA
jgi:hypothetical protein